MLTTISYIFNIIINIDFIELCNIVLGTETIERIRRKTEVREREKTERRRRALQRC